jgi:hypothetical protein
MCAAIGVDPFNQPDVEDAKRRTFDELTAATDDVYDEISLIESELDQLRRTIVLEAFAPLSGTSAVVKVRGNLEARGHLVVAGVGPRYLHSTGQLHKGGPTGLYSVHVDVTPAVEPERISGRRFSFHELLRAQSRADAAALRGKGRTVRRLSVASLDELSGLFG